MGKQGGARWRDVVIGMNVYDENIVEKMSSNRAS
jgi:hypothetical protein